MSVERGKANEVGNIIRVMAEEIVVFVTTGSESEAKTISYKLVQDGLVACVNIIPTVQSIFQWEGRVTEEQECLLILKTTVNAFRAVEAAVKAHHSYSVPEIIALPIQMGSSEYLSWIRRQINVSLTQE